MNLKHINLKITLENDLRAGVNKTYAFITISAQPGSSALLTQTTLGLTQDTDFDYKDSRARTEEHRGECGNNVL